MYGTPKIGKFHSWSYIRKPRKIYWSYKTLPTGSWGRLGKFDPVWPSTTLFFSLVRLLCPESQFRQSSIRSTVWPESRSKENNLVHTKHLQKYSLIHETRDRRWFPLCHIAYVLFNKNESHIAWIRLYIGTFSVPFEMHFLQINRVNLSNQLESRWPPVPWNSVETENLFKKSFYSRKIEKYEQLIHHRVINDSYLTHPIREWLTVSQSNHMCRIEPSSSQNLILSNDCHLKFRFFDSEKKILKIQNSKKFDFWKKKLNDEDIKKKLKNREMKVEKISDKNARRGAACHYGKIYEIT